MTQLIEALSYPFVQRAIAAGVMISLCAALLGVILVLKQYSLIGHGLGDVGFASTSLAVALGLPVMAVSIPIVVIAACLIMFWSQRSKTGGDTAIGMVATGALSIGVIITAMSSGFNVDVNGYMFGSILAMSREDVIFSVVLSIVILVLFVVFYNRLFLITFDENFAKASGIRVGFYQFLIALLTALTVVMADDGKSSDLQFDHFSCGDCAQAGCQLQGSGSIIRFSVCDLLPGRADPVI